MGSIAKTHHRFGYNHTADNGTGKVFMLHESVGDVYYLDPDTFLDSASLIDVEIRTNKYDMDTYNRKFCSGVRVVGDATTTTNNVQLSWSDDDYQTWSNEYDINLSDGYPARQRMGAFRRRAWRIFHSADAPLRLESLEVVYDEGTS